VASLTDDNAAGGKIAVLSVAFLAGWSTRMYLKFIPAIGLSHVPWNSSQMQST